MNITVIGFGNIAHGLIALFGNEHDVNILTSKTINSKNIIAHSKNNVIRGKIKIIANEAKEVIPKSDIIIFTVPAFAREAWIKKISQYIQDGQIIGSLPGASGFDEQLSRYTHKNITIFSAQRVPFIARIIENGKSVNIDLKNNMSVAFSNNSKETKELLEQIFKIEINELDSFLEVNLSNSNPILHTARLYELTRISMYFNKEIYFYKEWNNETSKILLSMDSEFMKIVRKLKLNIKSLLEHYEVKNAEEMTKKISSIESFKKIKVPLLKNEGKYRIDTSSRYFTEDVLYGLKYILDYAKHMDINTPTIDKVYIHLKKLMEAND